MVEIQVGIKIFILDPVHRTEKTQINEQLSTLGNKDTAVSPEMNYFSHDLRDPNPKNLCDDDTKLSVLKGDLDTLSKFNSERKFDVS